MPEGAQLIIMQRDGVTGFLDKEYAAIPLAQIGESEPLLVSIFAARVDASTYIHMKLSTGFDVTDWQYDAIYDYYDAEVFAGEVTGVTEPDGEFNPTWELSFESPGAEKLADKVQKLLELHSRELADTLRAITDKESEYTSE